MSCQWESLTVKSTDGIHTLSGILCLPDGEIKGIFHLVHGMCEYIERYRPLLTRLAENGYVCCGYDHLGHGKTVIDRSELGFFSHKNGWDFLVRDVIAFEEAVQARFPGVPVILFGHSMGSFIARLAAERRGDALSQVIFCGTGGPNPAAPAGLALAGLIQRLFGEKHVSKMVYALAFGSYNKRFEHRSRYDWLTTDRSVIERYEADPLCHFSFTVSAMQDLIRLNMACNRKAWFQSLPPKMPILLIAGEEDPVGAYGKGVKKVYDGLVRAGCQNVSLKLYPGCRHEIHNDTCREEMLDDILSFLNA